MGRNRVLSFMSQFSNKDRNSPPPSPVTSGPPPQRVQTSREGLPASPVSAIHQDVVNPSPQPRAQRARASTNPAPRPSSMVQTYQPPLMEVNEQTLEELQPIFTFLNSHANKLYQEGYFLKLNDQDAQGRPNADRTWTECFAQLVGTVLSLWDAAALDAAGQDGEVLPTFINLTDASIKMLDALPTNSQGDQPLQNVLSISTAGKNRYLLHFNSHHSLIQWTAGIRLAMYEYTTLQEAYTGALIAGKGKALNSIGIILEQRRIKYEDWVRVRFGAGTPWRRCWCVVSPPDEKEYNKLQKDFNKNKSAYNRTAPPVLKGRMDFYESRKITKKSRPIATITEAYSAYAIYPQSKSLIDSSTLVKLEGLITIHSTPPSKTEGFVFVMPEVHPAVTGFEMMLRWLFPVFDTFALYGRPQRLIADRLNPRGLMFAMPNDRRIGYLEILDVSTLILADGSSNWREVEWRNKMKELTARGMTLALEGGKRNSRYSSRRNKRGSFRPGMTDGAASIRTSPSVQFQSRNSIEEAPYASIPRTDSAPPGVNGMNGPQQSKFTPSHYRSISETHGFTRYENETASSVSHSQPEAPLPPPHQTFPVRGAAERYTNEMPPTPERVSSEDERTSTDAPQELRELQEPTLPAPVAIPPAFAHAPGSLPIAKPMQSPELRRANSRMSTGTLAQIAGVNGIAHAAGTVGHEHPATVQDQEIRERLDASGNRPSQDDTERVPTYATETKKTGANMTPFMEGTGIGVSNQRPLPATPFATETPQRSHATTSTNPGKTNRPLSIARKPVPNPSPRSSLQTTPASLPSEYSSVSIDSYYTKAPVPFDSKRNTPIRDPDQARAGVMKIAGNTEMGTSNNVATGIIPDFDFGPTINLSSNKTFRLEQPSSDTNQVPKDTSGATGHYKSNSADSVADGNVAWELTRPGTSPGRHARHSSSTMLRSGTPEAKYIKDPRKYSRDLFQGPNSRSVDNLLFQQRPSAGGAMNTPGNRSSQHLPAGGGLVGAIGARERERKELKQGINSQAVRQAIVQQHRNSGVFEQRHSQIYPQGPVAPNFHQQTQQFVQQQSQFSQPGYAQQHRAPGQVPQRVQQQQQQYPYPQQGYYSGMGSGQGY